MRLLKIIPGNIVPLSRYCSNNNFTLFYNRSVEDYHEALNNPKCHFHLHKLNIIETLFLHLNEIWNQARCQDCVNNKNDTQQFFELSDQLDHCIKNNTYGNDSPCLVCASFYSQVQDYYEAMHKQRQGKICLDIEDQMNQTRHGWSAKYKCCADKKRSQKLFISFASLFSSLPLVFYVILYYITRRKEAREELVRTPLLDDNAGSICSNQECASASDANTNDIMNNQSDQAPKASSSQTHGNKNILYSEYEKLNNLDHSHVREAKLINLNDEAETTNSSVNVDKILQLPFEDDDVSILKGQGVTNNVSDLAKL